MTEHVHGPWVVPTPESPLLCNECDAPWPGEPLPAPPHAAGWGERAAGYDGVADGLGFNARLRAALAEVARDG